MLVGVFVSMMLMRMRNLYSKQISPSGPGAMVLAFVPQKNSLDSTNWSARRVHRASVLKAMWRLL